jgi:hypothetical protein
LKQCKRQFQTLPHRFYSSNQNMVILKITMFLSPFFCANALSFCKT